MFRRAFFWSLLAEVAATTLILVSVRLASATWGTQGLSEWVLVRRVVGLLVPAIACGLDVSLTLAAAKSQGTDRRTSATVLIAGFSPVAVTSGILIALALLFPQHLAVAFFGDRSYGTLALASSAIAAALGLHVVVYAFLRGTLRMRAASVLHVTSLGVLPLVAIVIAGTTPGTAMLALAALTAAISIVAALRWLVRGIETKGVLARSRALVENGVPRVPAALALLALFGVPPIAVAHLAELESGALLSLSLTIVTLCASLFTPVSVVLLPLAARSAMSESHELTKLRIRRAGSAALVLGTLTAAAAAILARQVAQALLGHDDPVLARLIAWSALAGAPYIYFILNRPLVDAHCSSSAVSRVALCALVASAIAFAALLYLWRDEVLYCALAAHVVSIYVLAVGTHAELRRFLRDAPA